MFFRLCATVVLIGLTFQNLRSQKMGGTTRKSTSPSNFADSFKHFTRPGPGFLSGGSIDFINNRQLNTTTQIFRLYIGEPGKFQVPVSILTGVSSSKNANSRQQDELTASLINPGIGLINMFTEKQIPVIVSSNNLSSILIPAQLGVRVLNGYSITHRTLNFINIIAGLGITFITGVWERNNAIKPGYCWVSLRSIYSYSPSLLVNQFFTETVSSSHFGYSGTLGMDLSSSLSFRINYFQFLNNQHITVFRTSVLQLSINYSSR